MQIYAIEAQVRGKPPAKRLALRQALSSSLIDALRAWLENQIPKLDGRSNLAKTNSYALVRWEGLSGFLNDGRIELEAISTSLTVLPPGVTISTFGRRTGKASGMAKRVSEVARSMDYSDEFD